MSREAFEALGDIEGAGHHRVLVAKRLQLRFARQCGRERHRGCGILRHQFCEFVDLAVRHLQHAADVAEHAAGLKGAEGDDLGDLIAAVALLHVTDHLVAAVLAEVDVEIGHRHAVRIEEALEDQTEADRIEIGDGQGIGHQRTGAGAAAGSDRNALRFRPLDEIGDDQEVTGIFHSLDDAELETQAFAIILLADPRRAAVQDQPLDQPLLGLAAQFRRFVVLGAGGTGILADREPRQDRLARDGAERTALGDLDGGGQGLRHVGKQHRHFGAGLEAVIGGQLIAIGFGNQTPAGDAEQRVMGFVIVRGGKIRLVGGDQRQPFGIGKIDQAGFGPPLLLDAVALQLDIEPVAEHRGQPVAARRRQRRVIGIDRQRDRTVRTAGQGDQVLGISFQPFELDMGRLMDRRLQERPRIQPHQAAVAALARRQQNDPSRSDRIAGVGILIAEIDGQFAADDRLDAVTRHLVGEFQRPEHVVGVGQRQRRLAVGLGQFPELLDLDRSLQQRIGRMDVEMDKSGIGLICRRF